MARHAAAAYGRGRRSTPWRVGALSLVAELDVLHGLAFSHRSNMELFLIITFLLSVVAVSTALLLGQVVWVEAEEEEEGAAGVVGVMPAVPSMLALQICSRA